jgi:hypothetical protein
VPLEFHGLAIVDPPGRGIRFAGYPTAGRNMPLVVCEVSADALRFIGGLPDATYDELISIFGLHMNAIVRIASEKFDHGEIRPSVTSVDLVSI